MTARCRLELSAQPHAESIAGVRHASEVSRSRSIFNDDDLLTDEFRFRLQAGDLRSGINPTVKLFIAETANVKASHRMISPPRQLLNK